MQHMAYKVVTQHRIHVANTLYSTFIHSFGCLDSLQIIIFCENARGMCREKKVFFAIGRHPCCFLPFVPVTCYVQQLSP